MRTLLLILLLVPMMSFGQNVYIPDANFKSYLVNNTAINTNGDSEIQVIEASAYTDQINLNCQDDFIYDLTGIEAFTALYYLNLGGCQLTSLDVSQNTALTDLICPANQLTSLNLSGANALGWVDCAGNQLTSLNLSGANALGSVWCHNNQLTSLDLSSNTELAILRCNLNQLTSLNTSGANALRSVTIIGNQLTSLDLSSNTALESLSCGFNQLTSLDVTQNTSLTSLSCHNNQLECLNVKNGNNTDMSIAAWGNPNLTCVEVDDVTYSTANWTNIDPQTSFSTDCGNDCSSSLDITELNTTPKQLIKIVDVLGRETPFKPNTTLLYIYDDGTVERKMIIE
jgi:hypothetical protein